MLRIDSHQHFWRYNAERDDWITDEMSVIKRDFLPQDLFGHLNENGFDGSVAVQSDQSEADNLFLLELAEANPFIKGIVGWVDLQEQGIEDTLEYYCKHKKLKGFRHVLQGETDRALMLKPEFKRGIAALKKFDYTYDILIFRDQLSYAAALVKMFPDQKFVLDHIAKPAIKSGNIDDWAPGIKELARHENVFCKISGMVTEADWAHWQEEDFRPYLDIVFDAFGSNRVMFGSDWPVCLVAGGYNRMLGIVSNYISQLSQTEQELFWGGNACSFYSLD